MPESEITGREIPEQSLETERLLRAQSNASSSQSEIDKKHLEHTVTHVISDSSIKSKSGKETQTRVIHSRDADVTLRFLREHDSQIPGITEAEEKRLSKK